MFPPPRNKLQVGRFEDLLTDLVETTEQQDKDNPDRHELPPVLELMSGDIAERCRQLEESLELAVDCATKARADLPYDMKERDEVAEILDAAASFFDAVSTLVSDHFSTR